MKALKGCNLLTLVVWNFKLLNSFTSQFLKIIDTTVKLKVPLNNNMNISEEICTLIINIREI